MQVYVLIYVAKEKAKSIQLLVAKKRKIGYFFDGKLTSKEGAPINGGGKYALPGGARDFNDQGKDLVAAGIREFLEETGIDMSETANKFFVAPHGNSRAFITANLESLSGLTLMRNEIADNLAQANAVATEVQEQTVTSWTDVASKYKQCPVSNELASAEIWDSIAQAGQIKALKGDSTGWFYTFLQEQFPQYIP